MVLCPKVTNGSVQAHQVYCLCRQLVSNPIACAPKRFYKALLIGKCLRDTAQRMSHTKVAPEGLKPQECERNAGRSKPSIRDNPEKDITQEAVDSSTNTMKLLLPKKVKLHVPVWSKEVLSNS